MNKARRHELKMLKYKKRLIGSGRYALTSLSSPKGLEDGMHYNFTAYRTSGKPCSCVLCSASKFSRAKEKSQAIIDL